MLNLLHNMRDLALQIPMKRKQIEAAIAELHEMELRMLSLANQCFYERNHEIFEERINKK